MEMNKIEVGGVYWDGRQGVRKVLKMDRMPEGVFIQGANVDYEVLAARSMTSPAFDKKTADGKTGGSMILSSMASWAKEKLAPDQVEPLLARLQAESFRPSPAQAALIVRLQQAQGENNQVIALEQREASSLGSLVAAGFLISPSGTKLARLSLAGRALAARLNQSELAPTPQPDVVAPSNRRRGPKP